MLRLARWCVAHRRRVVVGWIAVAVVITAFAGAVGRHYATNFTLPGTESQRASDLLTREFTTQSGDVDTIVFRVSRGTVDAPAVRAAIIPLLAHVRTAPHVAAVISPYSTRGSVQVSPNRMTAFATINYDKRANLLANNTGKPVLDEIDAVHVPSLRVAAGGQVIEQAEGFSIGPATAVGVIAALLILILTFGSLTAAGMPLITAGLGLITGVGLIGLATRVTSMSNVAPQLALMIGLGVGVDYALFIVTRFRENYLELGDTERSIVAAMDTSGRAILLAGTTVVIALLGMFATGIELHVWVGDRLGDRRAADDGGLADAAPGSPVALRRTARGLTQLAPAAVKAAPDKASWRRLAARNGGDGARPCSSARGRWLSYRWR